MQNKTVVIILGLASAEVVDMLRNRSVEEAYEDAAMDMEDVELLECFITEGVIPSLRYELKGGEAEPSVMSCELILDEGPSILATLLLSGLSLDYALDVYDEIWEVPTNLQYATALEHVLDNSIGVKLKKRDYFGKVKENG